MVTPKYVKEFMTFKGVPSIMTFAGLSTSWPMNLFFLMLIVRPNSLQACENLLKLLKLICSVAYQCSSICKQQLMDQDCSDSLSLLLILPNWTVCHQIWCAGKHFLGSLGRHTLGVWKRRLQTVWVLRHILVLLHLWSWSAGMRYKQSWLCCGCFHGRMILCWEVVDILFSSGFWTIHSYWQNQRLWWGQWKLCTMVCTVPCIFLVAALDCVRPVAFFIPSNIPLMFQVSEQVWIFVQSCTQYLFAQYLAVSCAVFLAVLRSSRF